MPVSRETLTRIKELVETERGEEKTEELKGVIERLKKKEAPAAVDTTTIAKKEELNFAKIDLPKKGHLSAIGSVYTQFGSVLTSLAKAFARFPIGQGIQQSLEAGGMKTTPEAFLIIAAAASLIVGVGVFITIFFLSAVLRDPLFMVLAPLLGVAGFVMTAFVALSYPNTKAQQRAAQVDRNLPFALRQMSTQVKAGVSFHRAMQSIASADYGVLSEEFERVVNEINSGETMEGALSKLSRRTHSKGLKRTITQILRSFKSGGNLSQIISDIADDVSFESRMNIRDFTEKLNFVNVIYIMVAVVAPVTLAILSAILQIPLFAGGIPPILIYSGFLGIIVIMIIILFVTKRMEPAAW